MERCDHIWSDFYPVDANANLIKFCFRCKKRKTKKEHMEEIKNKKKTIDLVKTKIKNIHIDLFW